MAATWALLGVGRPAVRVSVGLLALIANSVVWDRGVGGPSVDLACLVLMLTLWLLLSLAVVRAAGYRVQRVSRIGEGEKR